ncbi:DUF4249 domain-containing protein [Flammeovirga sp. MY04]|uniref:DUF4249 family protein n=1 Tax=Flammeovirga sp. MY04 TaxID=1191459 RepID=UPI0008060DB3|nr:DUF4249 family protein [Flammeovirga sp. MY04]ANQ49374.1 DUF4249 domain-containing protein [Flammeovirga sp. MY04]
MRLRDILLFFLLLFLWGCEEPIFLDVPTGATRTIIDANVSESSSLSRIVLSRSLPFNDTTSFPPIENASVVLFPTNFGTNTFPFTYEGTFSFGALYVPQNQIRLIPKQFYTLNVFLPGNEVEQDTLFQAQVKVPTEVPIDRISFRESDQNYIVRIHFTDPEKEQNYYSWRVSQKINGQFVLLTPTRIPLSTDQGIDGKSVFVEYPFTSFSTLDTIQVHLKSIDASVYNYYVAVNNLIEASGTNASVENPPSNFASTEAGQSPLGFLSVESVSDSEVFAVIDSLTNK